VRVSESTGKLQYERGPLDDIYGTPKALPIVQTTGLTLFVPLGTIKEYVAGTAGGITLVNGNRLDGALLSEVTIAGDAALGKLTIAAAKIRRIQVNPDGMKNFLEKQPKDSKDSYRLSSWPTNYLSTADVVLLSGQVLTLQNVALVYDESGCDGYWIPCRHYGRWLLMEDLPIKAGEFRSKVPFAKLTGLEFGAKRGTTATRPVTAVLAGDERVSGIIDEGTGILIDAETGILSESLSFTAVALVGTTEAGYVHVPLDLLKTVRFGSKRQ